MSIFRVVYVSWAAAPMPLAELTELVRGSHQRNREAGITGILCGAGPHFLQALEGPNAAVNKLLGKLYRDPRHSDVMILSAAPAAVRLFPKWGMQLAAAAERPTGTLGRAIEADRLDTVGSDAVLAYLCRLAADMPPLASAR